MKRVLVFLYGIACYLVFFATFVYAVGFLGNLVVPKSLDSVPQVPLLRALLIDVALLALFAVQHSVMARQWFKAAWTRVIPEAAERSTYVLFSSLALLLMFWLWQPIGVGIWDAESSAVRNLVYDIYGLGWGIVFVSTLLINHFDLFGVRQVYLQLRGRPYTTLAFRTPLFYRYVRHPLYLGWLMVFWATPTMTAAHLLFALATTTYILLAIQWEERDLIRLYGHRYETYRRQVPMILPILGGAGDGTGAARQRLTGD